MRLCALFLVAAFTVFGQSLEVHSLEVVLVIDKAAVTDSIYAPPSQKCLEQAAILKNTTIPKEALQCNPKLIAKIVNGKLFLEPGISERDVILQMVANLRRVEKLKLVPFSMPWSNKVMIALQP